MFEQPKMPPQNNVESTEGLDREVVPELIAQHISTVETRTEQIAKIDDQIIELEKQLKERRDMKEFFEKDINSSQAILEGTQYWKEYNKKNPQQNPESALKKLN